MTNGNNNPTLHADDLRAAITNIVKEEFAKAPLTRWDRFLQFSTSGLFFMLIGSLVLYLAYLTMTSVYAIFSFVLVVIGVAILLFGTGTQSMGSLNSDDAAAKYKVSIAGGAGVLALCIAFGVIQYSPRMKDAFRIEKRYLVVKIEAKSDGSSSFENYVPEFSIEGMSVPVMRRGEFLMVYVPYLESDTLADVSQKKVRAKLYNVDTQSANRLLLSKVITDFDIEINKNYLLINDAAFDFPVYCKPDHGRPSKPCSRIEISVVSERSAQEQIEKVQQAQPEGVPVIIPRVGDM